MSIHQADLTCNTDIEKLVNEIEAQDSTWVGLINNAGYFNYDDGSSFGVRASSSRVSKLVAPTLLTKALAKYTLKMKNWKTVLKALL